MARKSNSGTYYTNISLLHRREVQSYRKVAGAYWLASSGVGVCAPLVCTTGVRNSGAGQTVD